MLDEEHRQAEFLPYPANHLHEFLGFLGIHACRRLIQQQELRPCRQSAGNLQPPLSTVGQILGQFPGLVLQVEDIQELQRFCLNAVFFLVIPPHAQHRLHHAVFHMVMEGNLHIVQHRKLREQADILESTGYAPLGDLIGLEAHDALAPKGNFSRGGLVHSRKEVEGRGLARAIRPDKPHQFAFIYMEIKIRNRLETAKNLGNIRGLQQDIAMLHFLSHLSCLLPFSQAA